MESSKKMTFALESALTEEKKRSLEMKVKEDLNIKFDTSNILSEIGEGVKEFNKSLSDSAFLHTSNAIGSELNDLYNELKNPNVALTPERMKHISDTIVQLENDNLKPEIMSFMTPENNVKLQNLYNDKVGKINAEIYSKIQNTNKESANLFLNADVNTMGLDDFNKAVTEKGISAQLRSALGGDVSNQKISIAWNKKLDSLLKNPNNSTDEKLEYLNMGLKNGYLSQDEYETKKSTTLNADFKRSITLSQTATMRENPVVYQNLKKAYTTPISELDLLIKSIERSDNLSPTDQVTLQGLKRIFDLRQAGLRKNGIDPLIESELISPNLMPDATDIAHNIESQVTNNGNNNISLFSSQQEKNVANNVPLMISETRGAQSILQNSKYYNDLNFNTQGSANQTAIWNLVEDVDNNVFKNMHISDTDIHAYYLLKDSTEARNSIEAMINVYNADHDYQLNITDPKTRDQVGMVLLKHGFLTTKGLDRETEKKERKDSWFWDSTVSDSIKNLNTVVDGQVIFGGDKITMKSIMRYEGNKAGVLTRLRDGGYRFISAKGDVHLFTSNGRLRQ